ncbi:unnamed protein product [Clonostachys rosea f. rosea IK726]|uniref:Uncharacterized protein n=1 Tax=Clonostachys rosea f. rosea IK726 TaxID=1349383 RepID=A0ACA9U185_BIOOC|nr:unnamed protein product [Clonostachys rosea f. rosea IK726]
MSLVRFSLLPVDIFEALDETTQFYESILDENSRKDYLGAVDELRRGACMMATAGTQPEVRQCTARYTVLSAARHDHLGSHGRPSEGPGNKILVFDWACKEYILAY